MKYKRTGVTVAQTTISGDVKIQNTGSGYTNSDSDGRLFVNGGSITTSPGTPANYGVIIQNGIKLEGPIEQTILATDDGDQVILEVIHFILNLVSEDIKPKIFL